MLLDPWGQVSQGIVAHVIPLEERSAGVDGTDAEKRKAFMKAFAELSTRINLLLSLPLDKLEPLALQKKLEEIGLLGSETPQ